MTGMSRYDIWRTAAPEDPEPPHAEDIRALADEVSTRLQEMGLTTKQADAIAEWLRDKAIDNALENMRNEPDDDRW